MSVTDKINKILKIRDSYKAPDRIYEILTGDIEERDKVFREFLELFEYDVSYDWFHQYFQDEHADRKNKKQDFTPNSVSDLLSAIADGQGTVYEPTAGTGGILIRKWHRERMKTNPFEYRPSDHLFIGEDLSDRSIPFLLFNLTIRGMNAIITHCDVLTREAYGAFFIQNDKDDHLDFSRLNVLPYTENIAQDLKLYYVEEKYTPLTQSEHIPVRLVDDQAFNASRKEDKEVYEFLKSLYVNSTVMRLK